MPGVFPQIPSMAICCPKKATMQSASKLLLAQGIRKRAKEAGETQARKSYGIFKAKKAGIENNSNTNLGPWMNFSRIPLFPQGKGRGICHRGMIPGVFLVHTRAQTQTEMTRSNGERKRCSAKRGQAKRIFPSCTPHIYLSEPGWKIKRSDE